MLDQAIRAIIRFGRDSQPAGAGTPSSSSSDAGTGTRSGGTLEALARRLSVGLLRFVVIVIVGGSARAFEYSS